MKTTPNRLAEASDERSLLPREFIFGGYAVAFVAVAVATFGGSGVVIGVIVPAFWICVFEVRSRWLRTGAWMVLSFVLLVAFFPGVDQGPAHREATRRMGCRNKLKEIAIALHNYHDVYKSFPPAYVADAKERRMHSWRVLLLPYLEDQQRLYDAYRFDEPWDGANNRELILQMPHVFCCPSQCGHGRETTGVTNYFAVVGENTAWPGEQSLGFRDIIDGTSNTLLLLEVANRPIVWTEPTDIEFADAIDILANREFAPHGYEDFFHDQPRGCNIALADGGILFVVQQASDVASRLLIRRNDGERFDFDSLQKNITASRPLRVGNCIRLGVFVFLALAPLLWIAWSPLEPREATRSVGQSDSKPDQNH